MGTRAVEAADENLAVLMGALTVLMGVLTVLMGVWLLRVYCFSVCS